MALAIRDETMGSQLEEGVQHSPKKILHAHPEPNHSAQSGMSMAQSLGSDGCCESYQSLQFPPNCRTATVAAVRMSFRHVQIASS